MDDETRRFIYTANRNFWRLQCDPPWDGTVRKPDARVAASISGAPKTSEGLPFEQWVLNTAAGQAAFELMKRVNDKASAIDKLQALWEKFELRPRGSKATVEIEDEDEDDC